MTLTFHLAGINNQNFLMRDEETGTWWQQISGAAVAGPLAGKHLTLIPCDELTFRLWKAEQPRGTVLNDVPGSVSEYASRDWDIHMKKVPTVLTHAQPGLAARDLMLGVRAFGASRAFPFEALLKQKLINDRIGPEPVVVVVGPDRESARVFRSPQTGGAASPEFYRIFEDNAKLSPEQMAAAPLMMDDATGSKWNFRGCAVDGPSKGSCLQQISAIKDYWFDWREYNPATTVYRSPEKIRTPQETDSRTAPGSAR